MNAGSDLRLVRAVDKKRMAGCSADGSGVYVDVFEESERQAAHHGSHNVVPSQRFATLWIIVRLPVGALISSNQLLLKTQGLVMTGG
jgi:hypothetical protein